MKVSLPREQRKERGRKYDVTQRAKEATFEFHHGLSAQVK